MTRVERRRKAIDVERVDGPFADPRDVAAQWEELRSCLVCGEVMPDSHRRCCSDECDRAWSRKRGRVLRANLKWGGR